MVLWALAAAIACAAPLLRTPAGWARGTTVAVADSVLGAPPSSVNVYKGVRYASAPAGLAGRWRAPTRLHNWACRITFRNPSHVASREIHCKKLSYLKSRIASSNYLVKQTFLQHIVQRSSNFQMVKLLPEYA